MTDAELFPSELPEVLYQAIEVYDAWVQKHLLEKQ